MGFNTPKRSDTNRSQNSQGNSTQLKYIDSADFWKNSGQALEDDPLDSRETNFMLGKSNKLSTRQIDGEWLLRRCDA